MKAAAAAIGVITNIVSPTAAQFYRQTGSNTARNIVQTAHQERGNAARKGTSDINNRKRSTRKK